MQVDRAGLAVAILFLVFIAYEIAGGSDYRWAANWHTLSFFGYRILWVKVLLIVGPPSIYIGWMVWHLNHFVPK